MNARSPAVLDLDQRARPVRAGRIRPREVVRLVHPASRVGEAGAAGCAPKLRVVALERPRAVRMAEEDMLGVDAQASQHATYRAQARSAQLAGRRAEAVAGREGDDRRHATRTGGRGCSPRNGTAGAQPRLDGAHQSLSLVGESLQPRALGYGIEQRVRRSQHRLIVVGSRGRRRARALKCCEQRGSGALERRCRAVDVHVVSVRRPDPGCDREAGVGDSEPRAEDATHGTQQAALARADRADTARGPSHPTAEGLERKAVVVVARNEHDLASAQRPADVSQKRARFLERAPDRSIAQLERVAQHYEPLVAAESLHQPFTDAVQPKQVHPHAGAEVEIRDDGGAHGPDRLRAPVTVAKPDDVVELGARDLENDGVLDCLDGVDDLWLVAPDSAGLDLLLDERVRVVTLAEDHSAREQVGGLVLAFVVLQRQPVPCAHVQELAGIEVGVGEPDLVTPWLGDVQRSHRLIEHSILLFLVHRGGVAPTRLTASAAAMSRTSLRRHLGADGRGALARGQRAAKAAAAAVMQAVDGGLALAHAARDLAGRETYDVTEHDDLALIVRQRLERLA